MQYPFSYDGQRCQVVGFVGATQVRIRFANVTALQVSENTHEAVVSCLHLQSFGFRQ